MRREPLLQVARFAAVGALNTALDFAVLNVLIAAFGVGEAGDPHFATFKAVSFAVAVAQSYLLNKLWVFRAGSLADRGTGQEVASFLAVSAASLLVNVGFASAAFGAARGAFPGVAEWILANGAAAVGTLAAVTFNFIGYRYLVFRDRRAPAGQLKKVA